jgi:hypothetical protein
VVIEVHTNLVPPTSYFSLEHIDTIGLNRSFTSSIIRGEPPIISQSNRKVSSTFLQHLSHSNHSRCLYSIYFVVSSSASRLRHIQPVRRHITLFWYLLMSAVIAKEVSRRYAQMEWLAFQSMCRTITTKSRQWLDLTRNDIRMN